MVNHKDAIVENLKAMRLIETKNKQFFKARAYEKVIKQLEAFSEPIKSVSDLDKIDGLGQGIRDKIQRIIDTGCLEQVTKQQEDLHDEKVIEELKAVMAIGGVKARELVEKHGIRSIIELRSREDLLNEKQRLGLKHHEDFVARIPRKEMDKHKEFLTQAIPSHFQFEVTGSYRRGLASSGDIDVLVTSKSETYDANDFATIVENLKGRKYLLGDFAYGPEKYLGIAKLPRFKRFRRIDILYIPRDRYAFALLYFTGSQAHNIMMRNKALELGFSLSEHGLKYARGEKKGTFLEKRFETEQEIFEFLGLTYLEPNARK